MFQTFRDNLKREQGTPKKKKKLNEVSTFDDQCYEIGTLTRKKSFVDTFHFIGNIKRKNSTNLLQLHRKSSVNISNWDDIMKDDVEKELNFGLFGFGMEDNTDKCSIQLELDKGPDAPPLKLTKKMTMMDRSGDDYSLNLYRHNSTIDTEQKVNEIEEGKYGENMYIQQIMSSKRNSGPEKNKYSFSDNGEEDRLLHDYEIKDSINCHIKHHENFICLNKLDKIFYYVKKISFSKGIDEDDIHQLSNMQIKLYNRDDEDHLLRYYQSWVQDESIYLVFQMASTSLLEKTLNGLKMRENEVWALLTDCCSALIWMKEEDEVHLNIKPGNVLKCREKFKLADPYGTSQNAQKVLNFEENQEKLRLNFAYTAPEILTFRKLLTGLNLQKADMYSLGMCIIENLTAMPVYLLDTKKLRKNSEHYLKGYSHALRTLLVKMISLDPNARPAPEEISAFPDFQFEKKKLGFKRKLSC